MSEIRVDNITNEAGTGAPNFPSGAQGVPPTGALMYFAMDTAPTGWLKANGAEVSRSTFADLFSAIGTTFGAGDGSTTFELPDMRGEFPRGWDDGRGVDSGRSFGTAQLDQMQRITGSFSHDGDRGPITNAAGAFTPIGSRNKFRISPANTGSFDGATFDSGSSPDARVSSTTSGETRARNVALLACIKF